MTIQTVDLTVPGGDTPRSANAKINANFTNQAHAASRLVGTAAGNVMQVGAFGLGVDYSPSDSNSNKGGITNFLEKDGNASDNTPSYQIALTMPWIDNSHTFQLLAGLHNTKKLGFRTKSSANPKWSNYTAILHKDNTTVDSNGFLKGASPIAEIYSDKMDLNKDATQQGGITFQKLAIGDYLVKGSLGFAQEGWHIETPRDANGNVLVAVIEKQLADNNLSIKTYAKKFDDETGDIVANIAKPRDIPVGRFISLRLHELPKEPPVMPTQDTSADAPAQTNNP